MAGGGGVRYGVSPMASDRQPAALALGHVAHADRRTAAFGDHDAADVRHIAHQTQTAHQVRADLVDIGLPRRPRPRATADARTMNPTKAAQCQGPKAMDARLKGKSSPEGEGAAAKRSSDPQVAPLRCPRSCLLPLVDCLLGAGERERRLLVHQVADQPAPLGRRAAAQPR